MAELQLLPIRVCLANIVFFLVSALLITFCVLLDWEVAVCMVLDADVARYSDLVKYLLLFYAFYCLIYNLCSVLIKCCLAPSNSSLYRAMIFNCVANLLGSMAALLNLGLVFRLDSLLLLYVATNSLPEECRNHLDGPTNRPFKLATLILLLVSMLFHLACCLWASLILRRNKWRGGRPFRIGGSPLPDSSRMRCQSKERELRVVLDANDGKRGQGSKRPRLPSTRTYPHSPILPIALPKY